MCPQCPWHEVLLGCFLPWCPSSKGTVSPPTTSSPQRCNSSSPPCKPSQNKAELGCCGEHPYPAGSQPFLGVPAGSQGPSSIWGSQHALHRLIISLSPSPGYYYDLDDSCDDSDEEEVRAHLRCVAEQPPLKLDTSSEVWAQHSAGCGAELGLGMGWGWDGARDGDGDGSEGWGQVLCCSGADPALFSPSGPRSWSSCSSSASPRSSRRRNY